LSEPMNQPRSDRPRLRRLVRRVDELELLLARIHRACAGQLGLRAHIRARRGAKRQAPGGKENPAA
jgi:hypothetical protein